MLKAYVFLQYQYFVKPKRDENNRGIFFLYILSRVISLVFTKLAQDHSGSTSALGLL